MTVLTQEIYLKSVVDPKVDTIGTKIGTPAADLVTDIGGGFISMGGLIGTPVVDLATDIATVNALCHAGKSKAGYTHSGDATEETVVELTNPGLMLLQGIWLDLVNMTQDGVIKCYYKIDGTNYREFTSQTFTVTTDSDGVYININAGIADDFKVTYKPSSGEGGARNIPYCILKEAKE